MASFPSVPFEATLNAGAQAYSPDTSRHWGNAVRGADGLVTVIGFVGNFCVVDYPRWPKNSSRWTVGSEYVVPVSAPTEPPPVEPPPQEYRIPPIIETRETDGTLIARYERML